MVNHPNRKSAAEIIATMWGWDISDVKDGLYQSYQPPVYVCGSHYYSCPPKGRKPNGDKRWKWKPVYTDQRTGRIVYESRA
jgi:hypothetical protein